MKHALAIFLLAALAALPVGPARAQQDEAHEWLGLSNQILELRHDLQLLRDQVEHSVPPPVTENGSSLGALRTQPGPGGHGGPDLATQLLERVTQLEEQVRLLRGRADEADNVRQRQDEDLTKQIADLNFKVDAIAAGGAKPAAAVPAAPAVSAPAAAAPPAAGRRAPELVLQEGNAALARHDYAAAAAAAKEVLAGPHPAHPTDANFLLAQALAGEKDWPKAAVAYDDTYKRAKNGPHAQDSLLGLAAALANLNEKPSACETLNQLHAEFPTPRQDLRDSIAALRQRAKCH